MESELEGSPFSTANFIFLSVEKIKSFLRLQIVCEQSFTSYYEFLQSQDILAVAAV